MHGVRRALLRRQAAATGLPLVEIEIPPGCPNDVYESADGGGVRLRRAGGGRGRWPSATCSSRTSAPTARSRLAAAGRRPLFPSVGQRHRGARAAVPRRRASGDRSSASTRAPRPLVRRPRLRRAAARRPARRRRPLRRERRVPHLRHRRARSSRPRSPAAAARSSSATASSSPTCSRPDRGPVSSWRGGGRSPRRAAWRRTWRRPRRGRGPRASCRPQGRRRRRSWRRARPSCR